MWLFHVEWGSRSDVKQNNRSVFSYLPYIAIIEEDTLRAHNFKRVPLAHTKSRFSDDNA